MKFVKRTHLWFTLRKCVIDFKDEQDQKTLLNLKLLKII